MAKNIDVLFVYTNVNGFHLDTYNFGIGYLSSILKEKGFWPELEIVKTKRDYKKVFKAVSNFRPKVVGFSAVSSQFVFISDLARMIRKIYKGIIVCGGTHPTIFPECLLGAPDLDGIFIGESDFSFADFVSEVIKGDDYRKIDNFCYVEGGKLVRNRLQPRVENLAELPPPDREIYDYQAIIDENYGTATIMTNRGCPFHCTYCSNNAIAHAYSEKRNMTRYNSIDKSLSEIDDLRSHYKFNNLWFIDDLFILNRPWLHEFLAKYKKAFNIPFMCHIRPDICTREILFLLKDAGCYKIFLAVESASDYIRNVVMKRNITKNQLVNMFEWAKEAGLETLSVNIIGVPGETEETILETIEFNKRMQPTIVGVNIFSPYEGTELGDYCRKNGLIKKTNPQSFFDRRQSRLKLPTISDSKLMWLYKNFQYLVYKDANPAKAREILWESRYKNLENALLVGPLFKRVRCMKIGKLIGRRIKKILVNQ